LSSPKQLARGAVRTVRSVVAASRAVGARLGGLPRPGDVRVSYGHPRIPRAHDVAAGGIVKLQSLLRRFPNAPRRFNVLYLVSSRLPDAAPALARAARGKGAAVVVNQNGVAYPAWHGPGWERINEPMARLLEQASFVFYQSRFCKDTADRFLGVRPARFEILYNAIDTDRFAPRRLGRSRRLTMLLGGSQDAWYRVEAALLTLSQLRGRGVDARLIVTGRLRWPSTATPREDVDRAARDLGLAGALELTGPYTQAHAPSIYQRADLLLHTKYNDPCPSVVVEAMASGLPVVYSSSGGTPELVGDDAGIGVPSEVSWERDIPPSPDALANAVEAVAGRLERFSEAARARAVERFDVRSWIDRHAQVFQELTA
jgi:glycosyltransferase involved in cell wall biosynthesis